jgi:hypothetical protein
MRYEGCFYLLMGSSLFLNHSLTIALSKSDTTPGRVGIFEDAIGIPCQPHSQKEFNAKLMLLLTAQIDIYRELGDITNTNRSFPEDLHWSLNCLGTLQ